MYMYSFTCMRVRVYVSVFVYHTVYHTVCMCEYVCVRVDMDTFVSFFINKELFEG